MTRRALVALAVATLLPTAARAHGDEPHGDHAAWTFDPWIVAPLLVSGSLYATGVIVIWRRAGWGRGVRSWQVGAYVCGWLTLAGALVSPLHWLGEHLFTFHMIEHEIVMALAAPLIALARPLGAFAFAMPKPVRTCVGHFFRKGAAAAAWRRLTSPVNATILHGVAIWVWHAPALFDAAVTHVVIHRLQHLSFLVTALLFWWALLRRSDHGAAVGHLFFTMMHTSILGALMTLTPRVLYQAQTAQALQWGLTPLEDQQLAGVVMWVPAGTVYAGALLAFAAIWIRQSGQSQAHSIMERER